MRFPDFLKATVLLSAAAASALGAVAIAGAQQDGDTGLVFAMVGWWVIAALYGLWIGRRPDVNTGISRLLAAARTTPTLPDVRAGRLLMNRLWPLLLLLVGGAALAFLAPQVPGVFAGGAIIWALYWRRQEAAVAAIEGRDGVRFYVEPTKLWQPISLVRTPGFKATSFDLAAGAPTDAPTSTR